MALDIFAENLIRHYEKPHNKRKMDDPSVEMHEDNPTCGDAIEVYLKIRGNKLEDVSFTGDGCSISMGSASILTDYIKGKTLSDVNKIGIEELTDIIGIDPGPARMHCATLSIKAVRKAILKYENKPLDESVKEL